MIRRIRRALRRGSAGADKLAADVTAEIEHHIHLRARRFIAQGMPPDIAVAEARRRFGPASTHQSLVHAATARERRMHWNDWLEGVADDTRYALRQLRRSPGFTAAATTTLALCIGANATMFGVIDRLLLQPPTAVRDPATVVTASITRTFAAPGQPAVRDTQTALSYPAYIDLKGAAPFERVAAYRARTMTMGGGPAARLVRGIIATADYFPALGVRPVAGRFFDASESDVAPGANVVVLSYAFWARQFGSDPTAVGRTIDLIGQPFRILGVAPPGFSGLDRAPVDIWIPFTDGVTTQELAAWKTDRESYFLYSVARLKAGTDIQRAAQVASAAVYAGYLREGTPPREVESQRPGIALVSALPRDARGNSAVARVSLLLGAVALLVLVLGCANVANLQLARSIRRRREVAVRLALGVTRGRLVRQLVLDTMLLGAFGGSAALAIMFVGGAIGRQTLVRLGVGDAPLVDGRVLAFIALVSAIAGLATALIPALQAGRLELTSWLRTGARDGGGSSSRMRTSLLVVQATLTVILLAGTGLFVASLQRVEHVPLGLDPDRLYRASIVTTGRTYSTGERRAMYEQLLRTATAIPGVESAALATSLPFESSSGTPVFLPGRDSVPVTRDGGPYDNTVTPQFFKTLGTRIVEGRAFTEADRAGGAPVVIVNQTAARLWWPGGHAVGKCVKIGADSAPCAEVVGVSENMRRFGVIEDESVQYFAPIAQLAAEGPPNVLYVRPTRASAAIAAALQRRLQAAAPDLPYVSVELLADIVAPRMRSWRMGAVAFGVFGALAVLLASVGLYGVLAYDVAQRRQEIAVRLALGATRGSVARIVLNRSVAVAAAGSAIGLVVIAASGRIVGGLLFHTSPFDPLILALALLLVLAVSVLAAMIPAARATRVNPALSLREG